MRQNIIDTAIQLSKNRCSCAEIKHYCITFSGKDILSVGFNCFCRSKRHLGCTNSVHAEVCALRRLRNRKKSFDLFVFRLNGKDGTWMNSQPCIRCENWMSNYPIRRIYYSIEKGICYIKGTQLANTFKHNNHYRDLICKEIDVHNSYEHHHSFMRNIISQVVELFNEFIEYLYKVK